MHRDWNYTHSYFQDFYFLVEKVKQILLIIISWRISGRNPVGTSLGNRENCWEEAGVVPRVGIGIGWGSRVNGKQSLKPSRTLPSLLLGLLLFGKQFFLLCPSLVQLPSTLQIPYLMLQPLGEIRPSFVSRTLGKNFDLVHFIQGSISKPSAVAWGVVLFHTCSSCCVTGLMR